MRMISQAAGAHASGRSLPTNVMSRRYRTCDGGPVTAGLAARHILKEML